MVAQIFLIRHGETEWSVSGRHTGRTDLPLTPEGERRATRLREALRGIAFTHVFTSPLQRARLTCELAGFGGVARIEPDLREWDYGDYEGRTTAEIRGRNPGWDLFQDGCPRGESVGQIGERADRLVAGLRLKDGTTALFSHGHFLRVFAMRWAGLPVEKGRHFGLDTGSLGILGYEHSKEGPPAIVQWNVGPDGILKG